MSPAVRGMPLVLAGLLAATLASAQSETATSGPGVRAASSPAAASAPPEVPAEAAVVATFQAAHAVQRVHTLDMGMNAYEESGQLPGLRLKRMWVATDATLLEIEGLAVPERSASAVIRLATFGLTPATGGLIGVTRTDGGQYIEDRRGGQAWVVRPGETVFATFGPVDDWRPLRLEHTDHQGRTFIYFDRIDPRFRERYEAGWRGALAQGATPEQMRDFLTEFGRHDPDNKAREVFSRLLGEMRARNSFEGYYTVYLLVGDPEDGRRAAALARTPEQQRQLEHLAISALADKSRLLSFDFTLRDRPADGGEEVNEGFFAPTLNFLMGKDAKKVARKPIEGTLRVQLQRQRPIPMTQGDYDVRFRITASAPRDRDARGLVLGGRGRDEITLSKTVTVRVRAPRLDYQVDVQLGRLELAYLDRGMLGGFQSRRVIGDGTLEVRLLGIDLVKP